MYYVGMCVCPESFLMGGCPVCSVRVRRQDAQEEMFADNEREIPERVGAPGDGGEELVDERGHLRAPYAVYSSFSP